MDMTPLAARTWLIGAWLVCLVLSPRALAQQTFELGDAGFTPATQPTLTPDRALLDAVRQRLAQAAEALAQGDRHRSIVLAKQAKGLADGWIADHPQSPYIPEAHLLRGDALLTAERYFDSLFDYELIARAYPQTPQFPEALQRELEVGRLFANGQKKRSTIFGFRIFTAREDGEELLIRIQERAPGSRVGEQASLALADSYFDRSDMRQAAIAYDLFLKNYPSSEQREWAMLRLIQASLARFRGPSFDTTGLIEAQQRLEDYSQAFPAAAERIGADALTLRITESLARRDLVNANWYRTRNEKVSATFLYRRLVREYPQTGPAREALKQLEAWGIKP